MNINFMLECHGRSWQQKRTLGIQSLPILCTSWPRRQLHRVNIQRKQQFSNLPHSRTVSHKKISQLRFCIYLCQISSIFESLGFDKLLTKPDVMPICVASCAETVKESFPLPKAGREHGMQPLLCFFCVWTPVTENK